jgi:hypothetical protein
MWTAVRRRGWAWRWSGLFGLVHRHEGKGRKVGDPGSRWGGEAAWWLFLVTMIGAMLNGGIADSSQKCHSLFADLCQWVLHRIHRLSVAIVSKAPTAVVICWDRD